MTQVYGNELGRHWFGLWCSSVRCQVIITTDAGAFVIGQTLVELELKYNYFIHGNLFEKGSLPNGANYVSASMYKLHTRNEASMKCRAHDTTVCSQYNMVR